MQCGLYAWVKEHPPLSGNAEPMPLVPVPQLHITQTLHPYSLHSAIYANAVLPGGVKQPIERFACVPLLEIDALDAAQMDPSVKRTDFKDNLILVDALLPHEGMLHGLGMELAHECSETLLRPGVHSLEGDD